jgi:type IV pilus assembly protein PilA
MKKLKQGFTLVELMIVVAIIGILAAIAIPNFIKFQARSKQTEAKANLKAIFTGQKSFYAEHDGYSTSIGDIGFAPERGNRYAYNVSGVALAGAGEDRTGAVAVAGNAGVSVDLFRYAGSTLFPAAPTTGTAAVAAGNYTVTNTGAAAPTTALGGVFGTCPLCTFTASAIGNIDTDTGHDYQTVSSEFFAVTAATDCAEVQQNVTPGAAAMLHNDVNCTTD